MNDADLRTEAAVFGQYLIGEPPSPALIERYAAANRAIPALGGDDVIVAYARTHPWAVPLLDAAAGLRGQDSLLRKKMLVMTAIVETTAEWLHKTEPRVVSVPQLFARLGIAGAKTAFEASAGLLLTSFVRRRG